MPQPSLSDLLLEGRHGVGLHDGLAGFAFTTTTLPNISRLPALVAGFTRVLTMHRPGTVNLPTFFTWPVATPAKLSKTLETAVFFISHSSAMACAIAPLDMAGPAALVSPFIRVPYSELQAMAPKAMKAMKGMKAAGPAMSKGAIAQAIADECEMKKTEISKILDSLTGVAYAQVKKAGKFTVPGLCMIKTRVKPALVAGKREMFGKVVVVKAKPAKTIVKAYAVAALKKSI